MKKFFQTLGLLSLIGFTFFYTDKTVNVVKQLDDIMIKIKEVNTTYRVEPIDAEIKDNTIIPGLKGKTIDENKSYLAMKRFGEFNPKLISYKTLNPQVSIKNNYNKFVISGNPVKKMVSLIFLTDENDDVLKVTNILKSYNIKTDFFVNSEWVNNNNELLIKLINEGYNIGNLSDNLDYYSSDFLWMDTIIKKIGKQDNGYCYSPDKKDIVTEICSFYHNYTIVPNVIINEYPMIEIKKSLTAGSIIALPINDVTIQELSTIINFIKAKGYQITPLNNHLSE